MLVIRRAMLDDADTVSALAARTFTETFGHLYPPQDLAYFNETLTRRTAAHHPVVYPDYAVFLLERDAEAVGICRGRALRPAASGRA